MGKKNKVGKFFKKVGKAVVKAVTPSKGVQKQTRLEAQRKKKELTGQKAKKLLSKFKYRGL